MISYHYIADQQGNLIYFSQQQFDIFEIHKLKIDKKVMTGELKIVNKDTLRCSMLLVIKELQAT